MASSVNKALKDTQKGAARRRLGRGTVAAAKKAGLERREAVPRASDNEKDKRKLESRRKSGGRKGIPSGRGTSGGVNHEVGTHHYATGKESGTRLKPPGRGALRLKKSNREVEPGFKKRNRRNKP